MYDEEMGLQSDDKGYAPILDGLSAINGRRACLVFEAAHPKTFGRPSDLVVKELLRKSALSESDVEVRFPSDSLLIKEIESHNIICIGGPRSNVLSRMLLEFEAITDSRGDRYFHRIGRPSNDFYVGYIQDPHLVSASQPNNRLADALYNVQKYFDGHEKLFENFKDMPNLEVLRRRKPDRLLTCPEKGSHAKRVSEIDVEGADWEYLKSNEHYPLESFAPIDVERDEKMDARTEEDTLFDVVWLTCMPSPFASTGSEPGGAPASDGVAIIVSGCTALGTACFREPRIVDEITEMLSQYKEYKDQERFCIFERIIPLLAPKILNDDLHNLIFGCTYKFIKPIDTKGFRWRRYIDELSSALGSAPSDIADQIAELSQFNAERILKALQYSPKGNHRAKNIYVLGCYEETKTFVTQQGRALTLIHALHDSGRIQPDTRLVIIGAGLSGMTTAIAAAMTGIRVQLIERSGSRNESDNQHNLLHHLSGASHRFIHPNVYDWPLKRGKQNRSELPFFNWSPGSASDVIDQIVDSYNSRRDYIENRYGEQRIVHHFGYRAIRIDSQNKQHHVFIKPHDADEMGGIFAKKNPLDDCSQEKEVVADIVVLATGFPGEIPVYVQLVKDAADSRVGAERGGSSESFLELDIPATSNASALLGDRGVDGRDGSSRWWRIPKLSESDSAQAVDITGADGLKNFVLSRGYWQNDNSAFEEIKRKYLPGGVRKYVVVSGQGDGALIDILRLCIRNFDHGKLMEKLCFGMRESHTRDRERAKLYADMGHAMRRVTSSDDFFLARSNREREQLIKEALADHPVKQLFDLLEIELDPDVRVYNVTLNGSPFSAPSATAYRLLIWSLAENRRVDFITGRVHRLKVMPVEGHDGSETCFREKLKVDILRTSQDNGDSVDQKVKGNAEAPVSGAASKRLDEVREGGNVVGLVFRHGVKNGGSLKNIIITASAADASDEETNDRIKSYQEMISLLDVTGRPHPETIKFFTHTIRRFS